MSFKMLILQTIVAGLVVMIVAFFYLPNSPYNRQVLDCELKQGDKVIETLYDKEVVIEESFPGVRYEVCGCCWHSFSIDGVVIDTFSQSAFIRQQK